MDTMDDYNYNDEPDQDEMIAEGQWECAGPEPPSDDDTEDHLREEYNASDRAAKRPRVGRLGPEPVAECVSASSEPSGTSGETNGTVAAADDDADVGEAITNHANGNRVNLSEYPTIHERSISSDVAFVTKLESVNGDE